MPKISVIVPVYNVEQYIDKCIMSIIQQKYKKLEIILIDDGSTDQSGEICDLYAEKDDRIKVIHQKNSGAVYARKTGIRMASGEYFSFIDSDDWIEVDFYSHAMEIMKKYQVDIITMGCYLEYKDYQKVQKGNCGFYKIKESGQKEQKIENKFTSHTELLNNISTYACDKIYTREVIEKYYLTIPDKIVFAEDAACIYTSVPYLKSIYISDKICYHYNQKNENSVGKGMRRATSYLEDLTKVYQYILKNIEMHESSEELRTYLNKWYLEILFSILPNSVLDTIKYYQFPEELIKNCKVVIYGAGVVGKSYYRQLKNINDVQIVGVIDQYQVGNEVYDLIVKGIEELSSMEYDMLIIAIKDKILADKIIDTLKLDYNIKREKIVWRRPTELMDIIC